MDYALGLGREVLRADDRSAHAHRLVGRLLLLSGNHDEGLAHAERAFRLNPHHSDMMMSYGFALMWTGDAGTGLQQIERALAINPYAPAYYKAYLSLAYFLVGRNAEGLRILESVDGSVGPTRMARIANLAAMDRPEEAQAESRILRQERPDFDLDRTLTALPFKRDEDRARLGEAMRWAGLGA